MEYHSRTEKQMAKPTIISRHVSKQPRRECNICSHEFQPRSRYERFCESCRAHSESYHYGEWLVTAS